MKPGSTVPPTGAEKRKAGWEFETPEMRRKRFEVAQHRGMNSRRPAPRPVTVTAVGIWPWVRKTWADVLYWKVDGGLIILRGQDGIPRAEPLGREFIGAYATVQE